MRLQDSNTTATSQEPMRTEGTVLEHAAADHGPLARPQHRIAAGDVAAGNPSRDRAHATDQPLDASLDARLETHAQWSLSALDTVFSRMTSSFMQEVDFTRIDFDAIERA